MLKNPTSYSLIEYGGVFLLAVWGGLVNYWRRLKNKTIPVFSLMELIGEMATSGFVGVLAFWMCEAADVQPLITAVTVGISGHFGGRSLILIEEWLISKLSGGMGMAAKELEKERNRQRQETQKGEETKT